MNFRSRILGTAALALVATLAPLTANAQSASPAKPAAEAAAVDQRWVWDLTKLFPSDEAWDAERKAVLADLPELAALKGTLGKDAKTMAAAFEKMSDVGRRLERLWVYASTQASTDSRDARNQERASLMRQLGGELGSALAWVDPEVQAIGKEKVESFIKAEPALKNHAFRLRDIIRTAEHTLTPEAEAALAAVSPVLTASGTTYNLLATVDVDWPSIQVDGKDVKLNQIGYAKLREHPDREVRKNAFNTFWTKWKQYENTFGSTLGTRIEAGVANAKLRGYKSAVAASLAGNDIPEEVYRTLVAEANNGLPTLHRYFKLRQKMLKLPDLHYYDIYPALVELGKEYPVDMAGELTLAATRPLGDEYQGMLKQAISERSMHVFPAEGKRSGAYQTGVYGVTPFVFLNHQNNFDSVSTYAHEWGHGMHTALANKNQPFETADYSLFVAEIASITNEILLSDFMLEQAGSKEERLYYLGHALESMRGTFFRQTMFAEFELATHDAVQQGEALSGKKMTEIYCGLLKKYHGADQGVMNIDPAYCQEWAYIPHFYRPFYVYQYATSMAASAYWAEQVETGGEKVREQYLNILRAGGSQYPYQLLKKAGLDMATPAPYQALIKRMSAIMDEMEKILNDKT
ncbi:oligoendopeptidase F [Indioceanicola profundi]|uniref:oligoendopeptidase F n=1 Tax=Indioceanicola profundi TaxID=2220096 RepID=UPI000E6AC7C0|nr:oligoendopeptidase F [Indioceanicola profundi]